MFRYVLSNTLKASSISSLKRHYNTILYDYFPEKKVGKITLNRPKALNALNNELISELVSLLADLNKDELVNVVVLTGSEKAFAAGADIKEMYDMSATQAMKSDFIGEWAKVGTNLTKPLLAAVNGFALGGGCELAMMADIIYAGNKAKFGQPEINLGVIPGAGGTQRLVRLVGKSVAMHMILTGEMISADKAKEIGLVSEVFEAQTLVDEVMKIASKIAKNSQLAASLCKQSVNAALECSLAQGLLFERKLFYSTFSTNDKMEGMRAFMEKRQPNFTNS